MCQRSQRILFVVNTPDFFLSHRLALAIEAKRRGFEVHVATGKGTGLEKILTHGFVHHEVSFSRSGQNPFFEIYTLIQLYRLFREVKPKLVHLITIKPVLYGCISAKMARVDSVVAAVSGLGTVFLATSLIARLRKAIIVGLYRLAFSHKSLAVIFQNPIDRELLVSLGALADSKSRMIRGSGVSLAEYPYRDEPDGKPVVVMAARLLREKGVFEFVEAARVLRNRGIDLEMRLIGSPDPGNPRSVTQREFDDLAENVFIRLLGFRSDIAEQYADSNIVCLPSYYGEGLPKSLIEAAACGRAVVTTDHPGCREAIEPGVTGILVPVKSPVALADAIQDLIENPDARRKMGKAGRLLAEREFAIEKIVDQHMAIYQELIANE